jgi:acetyl-CoA/propionyl-CoA carboxylase biotin carboxyl carrier protein
VGSDIGSDYDPMLSKIISWGIDRETARRTLDAALASTSVLGVTTNISFLRTVLAHPEVVAGRMDTELVERIAESAPTAPIPLSVLVAAAVASLFGTPASKPGPWSDRGGWRLGEPAWSVWRATTDGDDQEIRIRRRFDGSGFELGHGEVTQPVGFSLGDGRVRVELAGETTLYSVARAGWTNWVGAGGQAWVFEEPDPSAARRSQLTARSATAISPMPGTVVAVAASSGEQVTAGQPLVIVEAMKMEHTVRAVADGVVTEILVGVGDRVALNQLLAVVEPTADS